MSSNRIAMPVPGELQEKAEKGPEAKVSDSVKLESSANEASIVKVSSRKGGIAVVAIYPGFYENVRREIGAKFFVPSLDKVGSWMKCKDPDAEKQHQVLLKQKKEKKRKPAGL